MARHVTGQTDERLTSEEVALVESVRGFVERDVRPQARHFDHEDIYPEALIEQMKIMGLFGLSIPEPFGDATLSTRCYAMVTEELSRGWMTLAGALGGHSVVSKLIGKFGTSDQKQKYLPALASGTLRATMALTEAEGGSDLQAIRTRATRGLSSYTLSGSKMWITNARTAGLVAVLCKTSVDTSPPHRGMAIVLAEKVPGVEVTKNLPKLGYKGIETCEIVFHNVELPLGALLGEEEGRGFAQMMYGLEFGRIQVAARALGVAQAALQDAIAYAQDRVTFGKPIWKHQTIGNYLADMATQQTAAQQLVYYAADCFDKGGRADLEAGMAKLFASEVAMQSALTSMRIHGAYGYSTEFDVERYFRDAPLMILGEGTNEIQRTVIARQLIERLKGAG